MPEHRVRRSISAGPVAGRRMSSLRVAVRESSTPRGWHALPQRSSSICDMRVTDNTWGDSENVRWGQLDEGKGDAELGAHEDERKGSAQSGVYEAMQSWLTAHKELAAGHSIHCTGHFASTWEVDGHEVKLELQQVSLHQPAVLVVTDGPLRQPLADYLSRTEANAFYDTRPIARTSALHHVPKECRMTFGEENKSISRLEAMAIAKTQAAIREQAADYIREGMQVPAELLQLYRQCTRNTEPVSAQAAHDQPLLPPAAYASTCVGVPSPARASRMQTVSSQKLLAGLPRPAYSRRSVGPIVSPHARGPRGTTAECELVATPVPASAPVTCGTLKSGTPVHVLPLSCASPLDCSLNSSGSVSMCSGFRVPSPVWPPTVRLAGAGQLAQMAARVMPQVVRQCQAAPGTVSIACLTARARVGGA